jgi:hypothetical protein
MFARGGWFTLLSPQILRSQITQDSSKNYIIMFNLKYVFLPKSVRVVDLTVKTFQNNFFKPNTRTTKNAAAPSRIITN